MSTHHLIKKKTPSYLTQQLNIFYPLKDQRSLLFSKFPSESLNPSRSFLKCFIIFTFTSYLTLLYVFYFYLLPGILEFWCLLTVTFKFAVLYNNTYRKKTLVTDVAQSLMFSLKLLVKQFSQNKKNRTGIIIGLIIQKNSLNTNSIQSFSADCLICLLFNSNTIAQKTQ